jgi:hypothetical protein
MDIIWTSSNYWFRLPSLESSSFYYDATCLNNWFFKYKTKDNLIYASFLSVILSCLIYVICVRLHSFVVSNTYLRYLCSFAFICGIQHLFTLFVFACIHLWYPTLIYVIFVRLHSFVVSNTYLRYLCSLAFICGIHVSVPKHYLLSCW